MLVMEFDHELVELATITAGSIDFSWESEPAEFRGY